MRIGLLAFLLVCIAPWASGCMAGDPAGEGRAPAPEIHMPPAPSAPVPLAKLLDSLHLRADRIWLHVDKSDRTFRVLVDSTELKRYPCVLGEHPVGDKMRQGDRRTPEGTFTFRSKRKHDKWHVFIWIDYPNAESWRRFKQRKADGEIPANADIGGEVGIHGVPEGMDRWIEQGVDWTWGCIALRNADVDEIYPYITPQRTRLVIVP
jgi:murein L,D-transpeptidase YafK